MAPGSMAGRVLIRRDAGPALFIHGKFFEEKINRGLLAQVPFNVTFLWIS